MRGLYFILILLYLSACKENRGGGVVFSFDDQYIDEWIAARNLFKKYNIEATFFISRPKMLDSSMVEKLKVLQSDGNEIACHGYNHINAGLYRDSLETYIEIEVLPSLNKLRELGFQVESFAYPFGISFNQLDSMLLKYVKFVRKATWNSRQTQLFFYNEIYAKQNHFRIISAMGIDQNYQISFSNLKKALVRASRRGEVLILYAHSIGDDSDAYMVNKEYLEQLFIHCNESNLKSICVKDLGSFW